MLLLLLVELLVVLFDREQLGLDLNHFLFVQLQELHVAHLLFVGNGLVSFVQGLPESLQPSPSSVYTFVNLNLDVDFGQLGFLLLHGLVGGVDRVLEEILGGEAGSVVSLKHQTVLHEVGHKLLSKHHHVVGFDLEWHAAFAELPVDKQLATFIFESVFFLLQILCQRLDFTFEKGGELVEARVDNQLQYFEPVGLVRHFEHEGLRELIGRRF